MKTYKTFDNTLKDPNTKARYDKARDLVINEGKTIVGIAKKFNINTLFFSQYVKQLYPDIVKDRRAYAKRSRNGNRKQLPTGLKIVASTREEEKIAKHRAELFADSGIVYKRHEKTTLCELCLFYVPWTTMFDVNQHCQSQKHKRLLEIAKKQAPPKSG